MAGNLLWTACAAALLTAVLLTSHSKALLCYNCHLYPGRNTCMDDHLLMLEHQRFHDSITLWNETAEDFRSNLVANCSADYHMCVIEYIIEGDKTLKMMYRDCSDGSSFSTNLSGTRLYGIKADNVTHCTYNQNLGGTTVCISLCDSGDFCNGPQYAGDTGRASAIGWSARHVVVTSAAYFLLMAIG